MKHASDSMMPLSEEAIPLREIGRLERFLGPEFYRIFRGVFTNPLSVIGIGLIVFFILVAVFAPLIIPPVDKVNPFMIPRDGFGAVPKPPGAEWIRRAPELPFWFKALTGRDHWFHILGTASGQWDIFYGLVWGTRTAIIVGVLIEGITLLIGIIIGAVSSPPCSARESGRRRSRSSLSGG
jgi:peptide/nickel transport system permease protein